MQLINALSLTSSVTGWLTATRQPRILHVFDRACNLINERREVLSFVAPPIGNGPFNLVADTDMVFTEHINLESLVSSSQKELTLGNVTIRATDATIWNPRPNWEMLHARKEVIASCLKQVLLPDTSPSILQFYSRFLSSLTAVDIPSSISAAKKLAGLGPGLTPSGDDFLMGAMHAVWIIRPPDLASRLTRAIAEEAAPRTTSLAAAWITSASRGEAGELWHNFLKALVTGEEPGIQESYERILAVGETSGADALAGFVGIFRIQSVSPI